MDDDRLRFVFGDAVLDGFDLEDESDRIELVEQLAGLPAGSPQRRSRMAMRTVVVNQILDDDPPQTWQTAQRLTDLGIGRDEVFNQLAMVMGEQLSTALKAGTPVDVAAFVQTLDSLPLPDSAAITRRLLETARARPGISAGDHVAEVVESFALPGSIIEMLVDTVLERLIDGPLLWLPNDLTVVIPDLVDGTTFTHRLTDFETGSGVLRVGFDFGAFTRIDHITLNQATVEDVTLDGVELEQFYTEAGELRWQGPQGWLEDFKPGDLLACTTTLDTASGDTASGDTASGDAADDVVRATVSIEAVTVEPDVDGVLVGFVRAGYDELIAEPGLSVGGDQLAWWLLFHHPDWFTTAQASLDELCAAAGLERRGISVGHDESVWRTDLFHRRFAGMMNLVPEPQWRRLIGQALQVLDDPDATVEEIREALDGCCEPATLEPLADALFDHHLELADEFERDTADATGFLFDLVNRATTVAKRSRERATAQFLACVLYERCGKPELAETHLERAAEAQPRMGPIVERLGWYRFDRGDARGAMRWWRTLSELPESANTIQAFLTPTAGSKLGRNEPCWCGSGRKFKRCHQNETDLPPLPDRVGWLCRKASTWLEHTTGEVRGSVVELAMAYATGDPGLDFDSADDAMFDRVADAFADPIVFDAALHEGGLFSLFLHERGPLLPPDEQILAASWLTVDRNVHEIVAIDPGTGMTLRNLGTGDIAEVRERTASNQAAVGERYCARVVPDGAGHQIIGGIFGVRAGHETTVGDLCTSNDPIGLCAWAGAQQQPPRIVHTPGMIDDLFDRDAIQHTLDQLGHLNKEEGMAALGVELQRQAQTRWYDEHIPALNGLTPRQAAADPTRREQLERLLTEFEPHNTGPGDLPDGFNTFTYDVPAMRRELGLD